MLWPGQSLPTIQLNRAPIPFGGWCARLLTKLAAQTVRLYLKRLLGKADALQIKTLVFRILV
jgi:hypothetical protein